MIGCPLCGKNSSLESFDPSQLDDDVYAIQVVGLGRGRGFKTVGRHSLLDDEEVMEPIKDRLFDLVDLLRKHGTISDDEIKERFGNGSDDEVERVKEYARSLNRRIRGAAERIEEATDRDFECEGEHSIGRLEAAVDFLVDDYNGFKASEEDEGEGTWVDA